MKFDYKPSTILTLMAIGFITKKVLSKPTTIKIYTNTSDQETKGYIIVNCKTLNITNLSKAKLTSYELGSKFDDKDDGTILLNSLFSNCYEKLEVTEQNIKNIYTLIFYAMIGAYDNKHLTMDQVIQFLNLTIEEYKSKGFNILNTPTINDIVNASNEMNKKWNFYYCRFDHRTENVRFNKMADKRDISTPTSFSSCLSGNYILIKDLAGRSHIFSKEEKEAIGAKIVELTQDDELPTFEVGKVTISDDSPTVNSFADLNLDDLDPDNIKKVVIQQGLGWLQGLTSYPRGRSVPPKKKK